MGTPGFWKKKKNHFPENLLKLKYWKCSKFPLIVTWKYAISQTEGYFENPWYRFLEKPVLFLLVLKWNL